jgi:hypothetical protein
MGIRSKIKGKLKAALGVAAETPSSGSPPPQPPASEPVQSKHHTSISEDTGGGNLRDMGGEEDVPWYLKYDDNDGWESTDAEPDVDED